MYLLSYCRDYYNYYKRNELTTITVDNSTVDNIVADNNSVDTEYSDNQDYDEELAYTCISDNDVSSITFI